ncbi:MAG TPA: hypothetical protein VGC76_15130 [Pyrinomonadaceae bacterium]|jgi:hypothetical protein
MSEQLSSSNSRLSLTPLGAGDLIDRAVRFYRQNFWTFVWIAALPILIGTAISIGWTILGRNIFSVTGRRDPVELIFYQFFLAIGNFFIWFIESVAVMTVMGGASRNFVRHLLFGEPITFRETYKNVRKRVFGLIGASTIITFLLGIIGYFILILGAVVAVIAIGISVAAFRFSPFLTFIVSFFLGLSIMFLTLWLFFLVSSRFAYVPQVMLVEGQGVFAAIGRSANLASGNVKRFAALFIFTIVAIYSALLLFYIPLNLYAWFEGISFFGGDVDSIPAWYQISNQVISQASMILLMPIWMIGLCLLYIDERVRFEGYDIELMAARSLGEIPAVPQTYVNPLQPALALNALPNPARKPPKRDSMSPLGLN